MLLYFTVCPFRKNMMSCWNTRLLCPTSRPMLTLHPRSMTSCSLELLSRTTKVPIRSQIQTPTKTKMQVRVSIGSTFHGHRIHSCWYFSWPKDKKGGLYNKKTCFQLQRWNNNREILHACFGFYDPCLGSSDCLLCLQIYGWFFTKWKFSRRREWTRGTWRTSSARIQIVTEHPNPQRVFQWRQKRQVLRCK